MGVALLVGGCGNRTASTQDAAQTDTILAEDVPDTVQTLSQESSQTLPDGAVKADEINGLFVFTKLVQKSSEDDPADIRSLWLYERKTGRVDSLLTTNPFAEQRWAEMSDGPVEVALTQIAAADKVCFVPGHPQLLLVEGCPDARNVWTYIVDLEKKAARQFPSTLYGRHPQVLSLRRHPDPWCLSLSRGGRPLLRGKDLHPRRSVHQGRRNGRILNNKNNDKEINDDGCGSPDGTDSTGKRKTVF